MITTFTADCPTLVSSRLRGAKGAGSASTAPRNTGTT